MLRITLSALYLFAIPGTSAWAQVARVEAGPVSAAPAAVVSVAAPGAAPLLAPALSAPALTAPALAAPALSAPALALAAAPSAPSAAAAARPAAPAADAAAAEEAFLAQPAAAPASAAALPPAVSAAATGEKSGLPAAGAAAAPAETRTVHSAVAYRVSRFLLSTVAALTGAVHTLPAAGPALTDKLIAKAADRRVVLSDFDDTLAGYNQPLPQEMVDAIVALRAAGKHIAVLSDRSDEKRGQTLTVFESLATLPVAARVGMYVAANSGGRVYRYDESGAPVKVFEAPAMSDAVKAGVAAAAEATKARLAEAGTVVHEGGKIPAESWGPYSYALMLKPGSSEDSVRRTAAILQTELDARGVDVEAIARFAKDPANPPYVTLSIITKEAAARYIAEALSAAPSDVVVIGDSMYVPHGAERRRWLASLGARLAGRPLANLGNRTDANMERGVPGALTLSVGGTGDPRARNLSVLDGKGPALTRRVLEAAASRPAGAARRGLHPDVKTALEVFGAVALLAAVGATYYAFIHGFAQLIQEWEGGLHDFMNDPGGETMLLLGLAGTLGASRGPRADAPKPAAAKPERRAPRTVDALVGGAVLIVALAVIVAGAWFVGGAITDGLMSVEQSLRDSANDNSGASPFDPGPSPF